MIDWRAVGSLVVVALAVMGSPGPATISLTAAGSAYGARRSVGYLLGIIAGTTSVLIGVAIGITAALLAIPALRLVMYAVGAIYILWLAYHVATAPVLPGQTTGSRPPSLTGGLVLGITNPKAWVAIAAVFASARLSATTAGDVIAKLGVLTMMIVFINTTWLLARISRAMAS